MIPIIARIISTSRFNKALPISIIEDLIGSLKVAAKVYQISCNIGLNSCTPIIRTISKLIIR